MIKSKSFIFIILIIFFTLPLLAQITDNVKKLKIERVSQAFGYLAGQEYSLNYIKTE